MGIFSEALEPIRAEKQRQKEEKERKRKARAEQGSFGERALAFIKVWCLRLFYTFFMFMGMYLLILCGTLFVPPVMAYILGGLGYTMASTTEILLSALSGLFLTAWVFAITLFLGKKIMKLYMNSMKKTMSKEAVERLEKLNK